MHNVIIVVNTSRGPIKATEQN